MKLKRVLRTAGAALCFLALAVFPSEIKQGAADSAMYCLTGLVPSLFPFMVLACYIARGDILSGNRLAGPAARYIFRLPECCAAPVIMSFFGGYPAGAKTAAVLLEKGKINREQAGRMLLFCVAPGPAFTVTFLGLGLLKSPQAGWMLFASVTLSGLMLGWLTGIGRPLPEKSGPTAAVPRQGALIAAVRDAGGSVAMMCACVVLFGGLTAFLGSSGISGLFAAGLSRLTGMEGDGAAALFSAGIEITGGVISASKSVFSGAGYAFALSFAGACVHLQIFSMFPEKPVGYGKFLLFRLLHGLLAAGMFRALAAIFPPAVPTAAMSGGGAVYPFSGTAAGGASLLLMCLAFLLFTAEGGEQA